MSAWVYILKCSDDSYYTGSTVELHGRIAKHTVGSISSWTASRLPVELVFSQEFYAIDEAFRAERQIKGWSRAKKEALIISDFDLLVELAKHSRQREKRATLILKKNHQAKQ